MFLNGDSSNCILLFESNPCLYISFGIGNLVELSGCLCVCRLQLNCKLSKLNLGIYNSVMLRLISGHIFGALHSSPLTKLTRVLGAPCLSHQSSIGFGSRKHNTLINSFFWLMLRDRLNTRAMLRRKNMRLDSYDCVLCVEHVEENIMHLFFGCPFSSAC